MYWREVLKRSSGQDKCYKDHCFAVVLYSVCYSIIFPCSYWNSNTLHAIIEMGLSLPIQYTVSTVYPVTLPDSVTVFGTNINVHVNEVVFSSDIWRKSFTCNETDKNTFVVWII